MNHIEVSQKVVRITVTNQTGFTISKNLQKWANFFNYKEPNRHRNLPFGEHPQWQKLHRERRQEIAMTSMGLFVYLKLSTSLSSLLDQEPAYIFFPCPLLKKNALKSQLLPPRLQTLMSPHHSVTVHCIVPIYAVRLSAP